MTNDREATLNRMRGDLVTYLSLPFYRSMLERSGFGDELAGFVMLYDESLREAPPARPKIGLWRLMVDQKFQGRGIGRSAMREVLEHVKGKGLFDAIEVSYVPAPGSAEQFYLSLGFCHTGREDEGEVVLELPLR